MQGPILTEGQLAASITRCLYCKKQPCKQKCPAQCSPAEFIQAIREGEPSDYCRAAGQILTKNPLGTICGCVCPDKFCQSECTRQTLDGHPIPIPCTQATILERARSLGVAPKFAKPASLGKKVAVVGGGAAGLSCAAVLAQAGLEVTIYEAGKELGGQFRLIPEERLPHRIVEADIGFITSLGPNDGIQVRLNSKVDNIENLIREGYDYAVTCFGSPNVVNPKFKNSDLALVPPDILAPNAVTKELVKGRNIAVFGGGSTAVDCAVSAMKLGAATCTVLVRRASSDMRISLGERQELVAAGVDIIPRVVPLELIPREGCEHLLNGIRLQRTKVVGATAEPIPDSEFLLKDIDLCICAFGFSAAKIPPEFTSNPNIFVANVKGTIVENVASGKDAAAAVIHAATGEKGVNYVKGFNSVPVPLDTYFMGMHAPNPFVLAACPLTDGPKIVDSALAAGWGGVVIKTAFIHEDPYEFGGKPSPIHVPMDYMCHFGNGTHANCDNVSGHSLQAACKAIRDLKEKYGNTRLIGCSTGGNLSGNCIATEDPLHAVDGCSCGRCSWRRAAAMIEDAGADFVEFSLSCPQGGEGGEGEMAAQDPSVTAKIIEWVMSMKRPEHEGRPVPKFFKLTGAVTSVERIVSAARDVISRYGGVGGVFKETSDGETEWVGGFGGITLANSFPSAAFGPWHKDMETADTPSKLALGSGPGGRRYPYAAVVGMSGTGVAPISTLTLSKVQTLGVPTFGNGGIHSYTTARDFLALGCGMVQLCALPEEHGLRVINDLCSGLSMWMQQEGFKSIADLVGCAAQKVKGGEVVKVENEMPAVCDFMEITQKKRIPYLERPESCVGCLNCMDCPYRAIAISPARNGQVARVFVKPNLCIGCSLCVRRCPGHALGMRDRTAAELVEHEY